MFVCYRALEILQDITQSITRRSKFTEFALISVLKYNVSVKYSLLGYLATTDVITFGFYDAGKVCVCFRKRNDKIGSLLMISNTHEYLHQTGFCQKVLTLEELCMEPVNQLRPVIVVNAIE